MSMMPEAASGCVVIEVLYIKLELYCTAASDEIKKKFKICLVIDLCFKMYSFYIKMIIIICTRSGEPTICRT